MATRRIDKSVSPRRGTAKKGKCIVRGCKHEEFSRGICRHHYNMAVYRIRIGKLTWNELEEAGLAKPREFDLADNPYAKLAGEKDQSRKSRRKTQRQPSDGNAPATTAEQGGTQ